MIIYVCDRDCRGGHDYLCRLGVRLSIKYRIVEERGIDSYVPESVEQEIDALVERELARRRALVESHRP